MTQENGTPSTTPAGLKSAYDAIVIGAGVSGLTSAALLSRAGLSVLVLESDSRPGGYLAGFRRHDFRFDSAIHWLNQLGPNGLITRVFDVIGKDHPRADQQKRVKRYLGDTYDYLLTDNPELFKADLIRDFPHEEKGINRFFEHAKELGAAFDKLGNMFRTEESMGGLEYGLFMLKKLKFALPFIKHIRFTGAEGVEKGLNRYFKDKRIHEIFGSEMDLLSCLVPIGWAYYGDFQLPPKGGSQVIPEWLCHVVEHFGNQIQFRSRVKEILLDGNKAVGCKFEFNKKIYEVRSTYVLAACDIQALYEKMLPAHIIPAKLKSKLNDAKLYSSSVTLSLALDCPVENFGFGEEMIYLSKNGLEREAHANGDPHTNGISILAPSFRDPSLAPEGKGTLTIYVPAFFQQESEWHTERTEAGEVIRGDAYKLHKQAYADILLERVEKRLAPGLRQHIEYLDIATPITHWRYTGNRDGSMMGARPGKENMQAKIAHYKTPVTNLILGGHWAELGGGVPIAVRAAANSALLVLQSAKPEISKKLADYLDAKISDAELNNSFLPYDNSWVQSPTPAQKKKLRSELKHPEPNSED
jgi:prolycopene isomerase